MAAAGSDTSQLEKLINGEIARQSMAARRLCKEINITADITTNTGYTLNQARALYRNAVVKEFKAKSMLGVINLKELESMRDSDAHRPAPPSGDRPAEGMAMNASREDSETDENMTEYEKQLAMYRNIIKEMKDDYVNATAQTLKAKEILSGTVQDLYETGLIKSYSPGYVLH